MYHIENIPRLKIFLNLIEIIELYLFFVSIFDFEIKIENIWLLYFNKF